jgi:hypothetical protein
MFYFGLPAKKRVQKGEPHKRFPALMLYLIFSTLLVLSDAVTVVSEGHVVKQPCDVWNLFGIPKQLDVINSKYANWFTHSKLRTGIQS